MIFQIVLNCYHNQIKIINKLSKKIIIFDNFFNQIENLIYLPIYDLICSNNNSTNFDNPLMNLKYFNCHHNKIGII